MRRFQAFYHFVSWADLSLGINISVDGPNIEIHVPFGFFRVGWVNWTARRGKSFGWMERPVDVEYSLRQCQEPYIQLLSHLRRNKYIGNVLRNNYADAFEVIIEDLRRALAAMPPSPALTSVIPDDTQKGRIE